MIKTIPQEDVYDKIVACADLAAEHGAKLIGLGAFTSVVGDGGITVAKRSKIAVTTGTAIRWQPQYKEPSRLVPLSESMYPSHVGGGRGDRIDRENLRPRFGAEFGRTILVGRNLERTQAVADELGNAEATTSFEAIKAADAIVTVTSDDAAVILPEHLKPGAVVCDVARPRDVSVRVAKERKDVLVIEGGVVRVPGDVSSISTLAFRNAPPMLA